MRTLLILSAAVTITLNVGYFTYWIARSGLATTPLDIAICVGVATFSLLMAVWSLALAVCVFAEDR